MVGRPTNVCVSLSRPCPHSSQPRRCFGCLVIPECPLLCNSGQLMQLSVVLRSPYVLIHFIGGCCRWWCPRLGDLPTTQHMVLNRSRVKPRTQHFVQLNSLDAFNPQGGKVSGVSHYWLQNRHTCSSINHSMQPLQRRPQSVVQ